MRTFSFLYFFGILLLSCQAKETHKVQCSEDSMRVEIALGDASPTTLYLDHLQHYPDERCKPRIDNRLAVFDLSLINFHECGVTRMINKLSGKQIFYHKIIIESENQKNTINVKCIKDPVRNHTLTKRNVLPAGFQEPEDIEITMSLIERAPEPILSVGVRQGGNIVTGELNVSPGTPLQMEIFLDKGSAPVYGVLVNYMQVTDTKSQEETIIFNGCSIDPYLFENFNTVDGDFLSAKFRAFKFPESTYVQFKGTVNVCLDKCTGVECSNGQIGYGRKRREISPAQMDPNKVYEISMTTFIKVNYEDGVDTKNGTYTELETKIKQLKIANQKLARNSRADVYVIKATEETSQGSSIVNVKEEEILYVASSSSSLVSNFIKICIFAMFKLLL